MFSNAVFHWIADHDRLFARAARRAAARRAAGGPVRRRGQHRPLPHGLCREVGAREPPYAEHIADWRPWNYAAPMPDAGPPAPGRLRPGALLAAPRNGPAGGAAGFISTVCLGSHLDRLPEALRDAYVADVLRGVGEPLVLDYVRLNIDARA